MYRGTVRNALKGDDCSPDCAATCRCPANRNASSDLNADMASGRRYIVRVVGSSRRPRSLSLGVSQPIGEVSGCLRGSLERFRAELGWRFSFAILIDAEHYHRGEHSGHPC